jgi:hypothetical protein
VIPKSSNETTSMIGTHDFFDLGVSFDTYLLIDVSESININISLAN